MASEEPAPRRPLVRPVAGARVLLGTVTGRKMLRYFLASVVNVIVAEGTLAVAFGLFHWSAYSSAILAAVVGAGPAYWLARRWVWGRTGRSHLVKEVLPFWGLALLGLGLTTWTAGVAERVGADAGYSRLAQTLILMGSVLGVSVLYWALKYVLLNRILFADRPADRAARGRGGVRTPTGSV